MQYYQIEFDKDKFIKDLDNMIRELEQLDNEQVTTVLEQLQQLKGAQQSV